MIPESPPERTEHGLKGVGPGWFVLNARDARWFDRPGRRSVSFTGRSEWEADTFFPMLGVQLCVLEPGEPNSLYHWETETEAFLVISGEALLVVEGEERALKQWDFVYLPPKTNHVIVGAGDGPCVVVAVGARVLSVDNPDWGGYPVDETALRHGAGVEQETTIPEEAYAHVTPHRQPTGYQTDWLG